VEEFRFTTVVWVRPVEQIVRHLPFLDDGEMRVGERHSGPSRRWCLLLSPVGHALAVDSAARADVEFRLLTSAGQPVA